MKKKGAERLLGFFLFLPKKNIFQKHQKNNTDVLYIGPTMDTYFGDKIRAEVGKEEE